MRSTIIILTLIFCIAACSTKKVKTEDSGAPVDSTSTTMDPGIIEDSIDLMANQLFGKWQSVDDEKNIVEFTAEEKFEYYDNEKLTEESYIITNDTLETIEAGSNNKMLYIIDNLTSKNLSLIYLGRGNTLRYTKVK